MQAVSTPSILVAQERYYGRHVKGGSAPERDALTDDEIQFIQARDSSTLPRSRVISPTQLGFADYRGNRQLLSTGDLAARDRVCLFLMDYPQRTRLKILGHARVEDARQYPEVVATIAEPEARAVVERLFRIDVVSFDWNCPKYITPRYTGAEVEAAFAALRQRITELEAQLAAKK